MGDSRSFGDQVPQKDHIVRGSGGLQGEVGDLRADTDDAFVLLEAEVAGPSTAQANINIDTLATADDTVTIGADVYEYQAAITTAPTTPGAIVVAHGADAAASLANLIEAINGSGVTSGVSAGVGTENVVASTYNTTFLHIEQASYPGGPSVTGDCSSTALSSSLTAGDVWDHEDLDRCGWTGGMKKALVRVTIDAVNLAADFDVVLPFTPIKATLVMVTQADGTPQPLKDALFTVVPARNAVTVDADGGTTCADTDILYFEVIGL